MRLRAPETLAEDQWRGLRTDIDRILRADEAEAAAVRERIAWYGRAALPGVVALLADAATDMDRRRLLTLRYRLVASGSLTLTWPGGLQRLADPDQRIRHQAAEELASNAGEESQELLLELFSDPDPFVRELSLRGLRNVGGRRATSALVSLLGDPEPNVRAAVLKQLSEDAPVEMLDAIADCASREQDVDLVVHAVRYLRAVRSNRVISSLLRLLEYDAWQVRAEAAEAIAAFMNEARHREKLASGDEIADIYDALLVRLDDPDAFVVSHVLTALANVNTERAVDPLVRAAASHPDLAPSVLAILARGTQMRGKAIPHLRDPVE